MAGVNESQDSGTTVADWNTSIPDYNTGKRASGAAEIRKVKSILQTQFPSLTGVCSATATELGQLAGTTVTAEEINALHNAGISNTDLQKLADVMATAEEINQLSDNAIVNWTTTIKTASFTVIGGYGYPIDSSGGSFQINLPPATANKVIAFADLGGACRSNPVTLARLGSDTIEGVGENLNLNVDRAVVVLWCLSVGNWVVR